MRCLQVVILILFSFENFSQSIETLECLVPTPYDNKILSEKFFGEEPLRFEDFPQYQLSQIYQNDVLVGTYEWEWKGKIMITLIDKDINSDFVKYCTKQFWAAGKPKISYADKNKYSGNDPTVLALIRLEEVGFNRKAQKAILFQYNGDVREAFKAWSETGSGLLNNKSAEAARKYGLDLEFVDTMLWGAINVRQAKLAAAMVGVSSGLDQVADEMEDRSQSQNESNTAQSSAFGGGTYDLTSGGSLSAPQGSTEADVWRNTAQKFKTSSSQIQTPTVNQIPNSTVATSNSVDNFQNTSISGSLPTVNGESEIYAIDQNGMQQKAGTLKNNNMGGVDLYEKGEFGIDERTATYKENNMGGVDKYEKGEFGIDERTATYKENNMGGVYKYEKGEYGIDKKTEVYRTNNRGELEVYLVDKNGSETLDMIYRASIHGGYDVYEIDINGMEKLTGRVVDLLRY